jgi:hypothetical protein
VLLRIILIFPQFNCAKVRQNIGFANAGNFPAFLILTPGLLTGTLGLLTGTLGRLTGTPGRLPERPVS